MIGRVVLVDDGLNRGVAFAEMMDKFYPSYPKAWIQLSNEDLRVWAEGHDRYCDGYCPTNIPAEATEFLNKLEGNVLILSDSMLGQEDRRDSARHNAALKDFIESRRGVGFSVFVVVFSENLAMAEDRAEAISPDGRNAKVVAGVDFDDEDDVRRLFDEGHSKLVEERARLGSFIDRVFPEETLSFFAPNATTVPHMWSQVMALDNNGRQKYEEALEGYLTRLLMRRPPIGWISDVEQLRALHDTLKGLVGGASLSHSGHGHNLSVAAVALLLASAIGPENTEWLDNLMLPTPLREVFPRQSHEEARASVLELANGPGSLFGSLRTLEDGDGIRPCVVCVQLTDKMLKICLDFPFDEPRRNRPISLKSMLEDPCTTAGGFVTRIKGIRDRLSRGAKPGRPTFTLSVRPSAENAKQTILEFLLQ